MQTKRFRNRWNTLIAILLTLTTLSCADYPPGATKNRGVIVPDLTFDAAEDTVLTVTADAGVFSQIEEADPTTWTVATTGTLATTGPLDCEACEKGSVEMLSDGSFSYTPATDFEGNDYLYINVASDTGGEGEYIILFQVAGSNDPPTANADSATTDEDAAVSISPLENDADIDLDDTFAMVSVGDADNGAVTADIETGEVVYTPAPNYFGEDSFTYVIADAAGVEATATVTVTINPVNDAPTAEADAYTSDEDTVLNVTAADGVLGNDSDIEDDAFEVSSGTLTSAQGGTVEMQADGSFSYTPATNYNGDDSFVYEVTDANDASQGTVTLTVVPVNDPPRARDDSYTAQEDEALTVAVAQGVLNNDSDVEGGELTVVAGAISTDHGSVNMAADGSFSYQPDPDFFGSDSFEYNVSDGDNGLSKATVTLIVTGVQDAPVAVDDTAAVSEGGEVTIEVLTNDNDVDGDSLTITAATNGANGNVVINAARTITYTPNNNFEGSDTFAYTISDGEAEAEATVTVTVSNVNDPPTAVDDSAVTDEETPVTIPVTANDTDPDPGDTPRLTVQSVTNGAYGTVSLTNQNRSVIYTPNPNLTEAITTDTFTYVVQDPDGLTATATVTVTVNNIAPVAVDDVFEDVLTGNVLDNDTDGPVSNPGVSPVVTNLRYNDDGSDNVPGSTITVDCGTLTYTAAGVMTYTRDSYFCSANESFTYTIEDSAGATATANVTWTLRPLIVRVLASPPTHQTDEDEAFSVNAGAGVLAEAASAWSVSTTAAVDTLFGGNATVSGNGSFSYTPPLHFNGTDSFAFTATDNGSPANTAEGQIAVTVAPVDDAPLAQNDRYAVAVGGSISVTTARGLLHNDIDLEGSSLSVTAVDTNGLVGSLSDWQANGAFSYTAPGDVDENSTTSFSYTVSAGGAQETATVTLLFSAGGAPLATADSYATTEDTSLTQGGSGVRANDIGGTSVSASGTSRFGGSVSMDAGGGFSYTPPANFNGTDSFAYRLTDGSQSVNGLVRVTVTAAADAPLAGDDFFQAGMNTPLAIAATTGLLANDNDADGDSLTVTTTGSIPTDEGGSAEIAADGSFTYVSPTDFTGTDRFDYTLDDGTGRGAAATVIVTVSP